MPNSRSTSKSGSRHRTRPAPVAAACVAAALGACLLWGGAARWAAETRALFTAQTIRSLNSGQGAEPAALRAAIAATDGLAANDPGHRIDRGLWTLVLADETDTALREEILSLGTRWLIWGLEAAPLDGAAWTALSQSLWLQGQSPALQVEALRLGFLLGPRRLNYSADRFAMALALANRLDRDLEDRVERTIVQLWEVPSRRFILAALAEQRQGRLWIDRAFADRPEIARNLRLTAAVRATELVSKPPRAADLDEP